MFMIPLVPVRVKGRADSRVRCAKCGQVGELFHHAATPTRPKEYWTVEHPRQPGQPCGPACFFDRAPYPMVKGEARPC